MKSSASEPGLIYIMGNKRHPLSCATRRSAPVFMDKLFRFQKPPNYLGYEKFKQQTTLFLVRTITTRTLLDGTLTVILLALEPTLALQARRRQGQTKKRKKMGGGRVKKTNHKAKRVQTNTTPQPRNWLRRRMNPILPLLQPNWTNLLPAAGEAHTHASNTPLASNWSELRTVLLKRALEIVRLSHVCTYSTGGPDPI